MFVITGGYDVLRAFLRGQNWVENQDANSLCFDFKWTVKCKDVFSSQLLPGQIVNHFQGNGALTSKNGLAKHLKFAVLEARVDVHKFFPKTFSLAEAAELEDFVNEFKFAFAENLLKRFLANEPLELQRILQAAVVL